MAQDDSHLTLVRFPTVAQRDDAAPPSAPALREVLGEVLRDERHAQDRTLAEVADEAAVSVPYLSEIERGRKEASSEVLAAVARSLDLELAEVLERAAHRLRTVEVAPVRMLRSAGLQRRGGAQLLAA